MSDHPHLATLRPYVEQHQTDLTDLRTRVDRLREMLERPPDDRSPKPPPPRSELENDLAAAERTMAKHEQVIGLAGEERVGELLRALAEDPDLAREVAADPRAFATRQGFELPDSITVEIFIAGRDVSARFSSQDPDMPFNITWSRDGFQRLPEPEVSSRSEPAAAPARARRTSTRK